MGFHLASIFIGFDGGIRVMMIKTVSIRYLIRGVPDTLIGGAIFLLGIAGIDLIKGNIPNGSVLTTLIAALARKPSSNGGRSLSKRAPGLR